MGFNQRKGIYIADLYLADFLCGGIINGLKATEKSVTDIFLQWWLIFSFALAGVEFVRKIYNFLSHRHVNEPPLISLCWICQKNIKQILCDQTPFLMCSQWWDDGMYGEQRTLIVCRAVANNKIRQQTSNVHCRQ